jgi:hypothetical protein
LKQRLVHLVAVGVGFAEHAVYIFRRQRLSFLSKKPAHF